MTAPMLKTLSPAQAPEPALESLELTILMPCLNEAETIEVCVRKAVGFLERSGVKGEVVVSDNGSTDGSQALATAAGARVIAAPMRGYGAALMAGIDGARGRYVIMGDADDSYDFSSLDQMVDKLREGYDVVMGNRFKGGIMPGAMPPLHRYLGNPVLSFLGRTFFSIKTGDFHCGLRGFSREAIQGLGLVCPGMEFASEMVVKASLQGLSMTEVPTVLSPDGRSRAPHLKTWRDGWRHLRFLLLHSPTWLFVYPGLALIVAGLAGAAVLAQGQVRITPTFSLDIHTMLVACFSVLIGAQMVMFGGLARQYGAAEGFLPTPKSGLNKMVLGIGLEQILIGALVLFLISAGGAIWAVQSWANVGFGELHYNAVMRVLLPAMTGLAVSIQLAASGFLASVFTIRRR